MAKKKTDDKPEPTPVPESETPAVTPALEAEAAPPPAEPVIATNPVDPDLTTDLDEGLNSVAQVESELAENNDTLPDALAVRDPKALNPLAQALLDRALRDREIGPVPEEAAKLVAKIMAPPEELRTRWTVSVPGYTLPTEVMAFPTAVNAEAAIKAYCDRLGVSRLPTNPRVESAE